MHSTQARALLLAQQEQVYTLARHRTDTLRGEALRALFKKGDQRLRPKAPLESLADKDFACVAHVLETLQNAVNADPDMSAARFTALMTQCEIEAIRALVFKAMIGDGLLDSENKPHHLLRVWEGLTEQLRRWVALSGLDESTDVTDPINVSELWNIEEKTDEK